MEKVLLSSFYEIGDKLGFYTSYFLVGVGVLLLIWVMYKYLDTSDLK